MFLGVTGLTGVYKSVVQASYRVFEGFRRV